MQSVYAEFIDNHVNLRTFGPATEKYSLDGEKKNTFIWDFLAGENVLQIKSNRWADSAIIIHVYAELITNP